MDLLKNGLIKLKFPSKMLITKGEINIVRMYQKYDSSIFEICRGLNKSFNDISISYFSFLNFVICPFIVNWSQTPFSFFLATSGHIHTTECTHCNDEIYEEGNR